MKSPGPDTLKLVKDHSRPVATFAVARVPDSARAYLGSQDFQVSEADFAAAKFEAKNLYAHQSYVTGVALAGKWLVSGGYDGQLVWWDTEAGEQARAVEAHGKWVRKVVASPDGRLVVSVADDMLAKVWDAATGEPLTPPLCHRGWSRMVKVAFNPAGDQLVTASADGTAQLWRLALSTWSPDDLEKLAELLSGSRISADAGSLTPLNAEELRRLWDELRARYLHEPVPGL